MTHEDAIAAILAREQEKGVVTEAELRQQLADVTNERDELSTDRDSLAFDVLQATNLLSASEARNAELSEDMRMVVAQLECIIDTGLTSNDQFEELEADICASVAKYWARPLAQSAPATKRCPFCGVSDGDACDSTYPHPMAAPATNTSATSHLPDGPLTDEGTKSPATDEQGA